MFLLKVLITELILKATLYTMLDEIALWCYVDKFVNNYLYAESMLFEGYRCDGSGFIYVPAANFKLYRYR